MCSSLEENVVAKLVMIVEVLVSLRKGEDTLLKLAVLSVDDFALVTIVLKKGGSAGKEVKLPVNFPKKENTPIRADVTAIEISLNFSSLAA